MRYVIYARGHRPPDVHSRVYVPVFHDLPHAKSWLDFFLDGELVQREQDTLHLDSGIRVKSEQLDQILACNDALPELPEVDTRRILRFKHGTWEERHTERRVGGITAAPRPDRQQRAERPPGYITITELCAASGSVPMLARAALRAAGMSKPEYGWAFDPKEIPRIKEICGIK